MQDNRNDRRGGDATRWASRQGYHGRDPDPRWQGAPRDAQGSYRPSSGLFQEPQERLNAFERRSYGSMDDDRSGSQQGTHAAHDHGAIRSRSADPGQSSYGGFKNEDPRRQRQQLGDYRQRTLPKGYTRSDERIREDICEQLAYSGLDVSDVEVKVSSGVVTLDGTVSQRSTKHAIEDRVDDCLGVQDIHNQIRVQRSAGDSGR